jgi:hypothetical protein
MDAPIPTVQVQRVAPSGTVTKNVVPSLRITYPSRTLPVFGDNLLVGGVFGNQTSEIYAWDAATGITTTLYTEYTPVGLISHAARRLDLTFVVYDNQYGELRRVTGGASTMKYGTGQGFRVHVRKTDATLLALLQNDLYADDGFGKLTKLRQLPSLNDSYWSMTTDGEGNIYVACWNYNAIKCAGGSLFAISPDGGEMRPFVDGFSAVGEVTWDPASNQLVIASLNGLSVLEPKLIRIPLAR